MTDELVPAVEHVEYRQKVLIAASQLVALDCTLSVGSAVEMADRFLRSGSLSPQVPPPSVPTTVTWRELTPTEQQAVLERRAANIRALRGGGT